MAKAAFTIEIDGTKMREALEGESLRAVIKGFIKGAARVSADHIASEARARLQRQLSGTSTGQTVAGIVVKSDRTGWGWNVDAGNARQPMLDRWLEFGTVHMKARPFLFDSARLEERAHRDRIANAIQAALSEYGLAEGQG